MPVDRSRRAPRAASPMFSPVGVTIVLGEALLEARMKR